MRLNHVTAPATDLSASIAFYRLLGLTLIVRSPHYARFELPEGGSTFSLHLAESAARADAPVLYFECDDLDARAAALQAAGVAFESGPADQRWLWREARLRDPAGNALVLYHAGANRTHPPWRLDTRAIYHIVITDAALLLVKHAGGDWRALQDAFAGFKASLGPYFIDDAIEMIGIEWPDALTAKRAAIEAFAASAETALTL